jgi:hypothetical protein
MEISYTGGNPGLTGTGYDGITSYFQNDDQSRWSVQLFYVSGATEYNSGAFMELLPVGDSIYLSTGAPVGGLDLSTITSIGFRVKGINMGGTNPNYPSYSDDFHISVVPVPAAFLLGLLGLGAAGLKLRKSV